MPDHAHLIVHPQAAVYDISQIRRAIKAPVARKAIAFLRQEAPQWLPKITRLRGDIQERLFWQSGGGYDRNIIQGATLMKMIDYLHQNPVRSGLVSSPREWTWSSARWYAEQQPSLVEIDPILPEWLDDVGLD